MFNRGNDRVPIYRLRRFDDGIMESPRIVKATRGHTRELNLKRYDMGYGDFETCCRAVNMLCELWREAPSAWFTQAVVTVSQFCGSMCVGDGLAAALSRTYGVEYLDGSVNPPNLIAWCAVCAVKGASSYDCCTISIARRRKTLLLPCSKILTDSTRHDIMTASWKNLTAREVKIG